MNDQPSRIMVNEYLLPLLATFLFIPQPAIATDPPCPEEYHTYEVISLACLDNCEELLLQQKEAYRDSYTTYWDSRNFCVANGTCKIITAELAEGCYDQVNFFLEGEAEGKSFGWFGSTTVTNGLVEYQDAYRPQFNHFVGIRNLTFTVEDVTVQATLQGTGPSTVFLESKHLPGYANGYFQVAIATLLLATGCALYRWLSRKK